MCLPMFGDDQGSFALIIFCAKKRKCMCERISMSKREEEEKEDEE